MFGSDSLGFLGANQANIPVIGQLAGPSGREKAAVQSMRNASAMYNDMRPVYAQAQAQALQNLLQGIGGPGNSMMGQVYGPGAMMDFSQASQNPLPVESMKRPSPAAKPGAEQYIKGMLGLGDMPEGDGIKDLLGGFFF